MNLLQGANTALLAGILGVLSAPYLTSDETPPSKEQDAPVAQEQATSTVDEDLQRIMTQTIRNVFKFPAAVEFEIANFQYAGVYGQEGFNLEQDKEEYQVAEMCGFYSAPNGLGLHGPKERFIISTGLMPEEKTLGGYAYFFNDGKLKELRMNSKYPFSGDSEEFEKNWERLCGDVGSIDMGAFSDYTIDSVAHSAVYMQETIKELAASPGFVDGVNQCHSEGNDFNKCFDLQYCSLDKSQDSEYCQPIIEACSPEDTAATCIEKAEPAMEARRKKSS